MKLEPKYINYLTSIELFIIFIPMMFSWKLSLGLMIGFIMGSYDVFLTKPNLDTGEIES